MPPTPRRGHYPRPLELNLAPHFPSAESPPNRAQTCALNFGLGLLPGTRLDNFGHLGGMLGGAACAALIGPLLRERRTFGGRMLVDEPRLRLPT